MATNPANANAITTRWRPLTDPETAIANTLIDDAWVLLTTADPTLETRLDDNTLNETLVVIAIVEMVKRVLKNPDGIRQESVQDYSYTRDTDHTTGTLVVTDNELDLIAPTDLIESDAFTIGPAHQIPVDSTTHDPNNWEWA